MQKVEVTDGSRANGDYGARADAREGTGDHDAAPCGAVAGDEVGYRRDEVAAKIDWSSAVDVGEGDDEEGAYAGEENLS